MIDNISSSLLIIGANLRHDRIKANLRLKDLAEKVGLSEVALQKMETGGDFKMSSLIRVMRFLDAKKLQTLLDTPEEKIHKSLIEECDELKTSQRQRVKLRGTK